MIRINLLPVRTSKRQEAVRTQLVMGGLGAAALLVVLFLFHGIMVARVASAESDVDDLTAEVERMKTLAAQAEQAEKLKSDLQRKLDVIKGLKANRTGPVRMLDELADASPEKLSLTSLDEEKGAIKLKLKDVKLRSVLELLLQQAHDDLRYGVKHGVLMIGTDEDWKDEYVLRFTPVDDILHQPKDFPGPRVGLSDKGVEFDED